MTTTDTTGTSKDSPTLREPNAIDAMIGRISGDSAALAALRRGIGVPPGEAPECWPWTVPLTADSDQRRASRAWEGAVHHGLTLYALHQQSQSRNMHHNDNRSLGAACRILRAKRSDSQGVERRFLAAATADTADELAHHLRGIIMLLRGEGIHLDYYRLIQALAGWDLPTSAGRTRRAWGRDFYRIDQSGDTEGDSPGEDAAVSQPAATNQNNAQ